MSSANSAQAWTVEQVKDELRNLGNHLTYRHPRTVTIRAVGTIESQQAEIERLRAALEKANDSLLEHLGWDYRECVCVLSKGLEACEEHRGR